MIDLTSNKNVFGLIGYPIQHSYSPLIFENIFKKHNVSNAEYLLFPLQNIEEIKSLVSENPNLIGLNITAPYKKAVIPYLDTLDGISKSIGVVNTIKIERNNDNIILKGFNTDFGALLAQFQILFPNLKIKKALILGTGGAAATVANVLKFFKTQYIFASRNPQNIEHISYNELNKALLDEMDIIINATPLGMFPDVDDCPDIPFDACNNKTIFYDLIYNPEETLFLQHAKAIGANAVNGMFMFQLQAYASWHIWNGN